MIKLQEYLSCFTIVESYPDAKRVVDRFEAEHEKIKEALGKDNFRLGSVMGEKSLQALRNVGASRFGMGIRSCNPYNVGLFRDLYLSDVIDYLRRSGIRTEQEATELLNRQKASARMGKLYKSVRNIFFLF